MTQPSDPQDELFANMVADFVNRLDASGAPPHIQETAIDYLEMGWFDDRGLGKYLHQVGREEFRDIMAQYTDEGWSLADFDWEAWREAMGYQ